MMINEMECVRLKQHRIQCYYLGMILSLGKHSMETFSMSKKCFRDSLLDSYFVCFSKDSWVVGINVVNVSLLHIRRDKLYFLKLFSIMKNPSNEQKKVKFEAR